MVLGSSHVLIKVRDAPGSQLHMLGTQLHQEGQALTLPLAPGPPPVGRWSKPCSQTCLPALKQLCLPPGVPKPTCFSEACVTHNTLNQ